MTRISRMRRLRSLQVAPVQHVSSPSRPPFIAAAATGSTVHNSRCISTTNLNQGKYTDRLRERLWKDGAAPGGADPYTERAEAPHVEQSRIPDEAKTVAGRVAKPLPYAVRASRIALPPRRTEAATEEEVSAVDSSYIPATTLADLEVLGGLSNWWDQEGHWGEESQFRGFGRSSAEKVTDRDVMEVHLRRAVIEVLAVKAAGNSDLELSRWNVGGRAELDETLKLGIEANSEQSSYLSGEPTTVLESLSAEENPTTDDSVTPEDAWSISAEEAAEMVKAWDPSWKTIIVDTPLKFMLRKRLYQLTGCLLSDAKLAAAQNIQHVLTLATKAPKPTALNDVLTDDHALTTLSNVAVHSRRITSIDKEVAVGRWKVIEQELKERDLPITGDAGLDKNREAQWLTGKDKRKDQGSRRR